MSGIELLERIAMRDEYTSLDRSDISRLAMRPRREPELDRPADPEHDAADGLYPFGMLAWER